MALDKSRPEREPEVGPVDMLAPLLSMMLCPTRSPLEGAPLFREGGAQRLVTAHELLEAVLQGLQVQLAGS